MQGFRIFVLLLIACPMYFNCQDNRLWRSLGQKKPVSFFKVAPTPMSLPLNSKTTCAFKCETPQLAFFCDIENKFRNRFKLYLKLRAGNDEMYRDMTR
jgi:hypothetical protein